MDLIEIRHDQPVEWDKLGAFGVVPDPMILRTAELFLNGRRGCSDANMDPEDVWNGIDKNVHGLLAFFDMLLTRERVPYIQYWETWTSPVPKSLIELADGLLRPVRVDMPVYDAIRGDIANELPTTRLDHLEAGLLADIRQELGAFRYDWRPSLHGVAIPPELSDVAAYLVGGLIFGAYAQASGADHLVQAKRSRLLLSLTAPPHISASTAFNKEVELFAKFRRHCVRNEHVAAATFRGAPSIVPYLLLGRKPAPQTPLELLAQFLDVRDSRTGSDYREWFQTLRAAWAHGHHHDDAERSVEVIRVKLAKFKTSGVVSGGTRVEVNAGVNLGVFQAGVAGPVNLKVPRWLRAWSAQHLTFRPHRRLLLRMSIAQRQYDDITSHLKALWRAA